MFSIKENVSVSVNDQVPQPSHNQAKKINVSLLKPKAVLHSCRKDKPQASVTADLYLPACKTAASPTHLATCLERRTDFI